ncbi:MAG: ABC transporter permease subunit [Phycisphaerales bacterium]|nr:ABC transporter permease subunit [Phycisphaerales bacterium]
MSIKLLSDPAKRDKRRKMDRRFLWLCLGVTSISVIALSVLLITIFAQGVKHLDGHFLGGGPSRYPEEAGFKAAILGSIWILAICAITALPLGVGTAVFLEEFKPKRKIEKRAHSVVQLNIRNLAGVPSVVYGLLGLTLFARMFGLFGTTNQYARWDEYKLADGQKVVGLTTGNQQGSYTFKSDLLGSVEITDDQFADDSVKPNVTIGADPIVVDGTIAYDGEEFAIEANGVKLFIPSWLVETEAADAEPFEARPFTSTLARTRDAAYIVATPQRGEVEVPASSIKDRESDIDTVFVRRNNYILKDGRVLKGELISATLDDITIQTEGDRQLVTFPLADISSYKRKEMFQLGDEDWPFLIRFPLGGSVLTGGLTLMLVVLPIVIISSQEALKAIPNSLREAALAMGCTRWQMVSRVTLPAAVPGIMTGAILAMSRAIGEAAPILVIGGAVFVTFSPTNMMDTFAAMPLQIYTWTGMPNEEFKEVAATGIIVLLAVLLVFNTAAVLIRQKLQKPLS